jgi:anti-sigma regulatory factor (Ser/Thr protein kinase)
MEISVAASPSRLAGLRHAVRTSLQEAPDAIPGEVADDVVLAVSEAATNAILHGSADAQPITVTVRVHGGWIEATIRDRGHPAGPRAAVVPGLGHGLWLMVQLADELRLTKARPGTLVTLYWCIGDTAETRSSFLDLPNADVPRPRTSRAPADQNRGVAP